MLFLGSLKIMKWRQLLWIAFCAVELAGNALGSPTATPTSTATETKDIGITTASGAPGTPTTPTTPGIPSSAASMPATSEVAQFLASNPTSPGLNSKWMSLQPSQAFTQLLGTPSNPDHTSQGFSTTESPATQPNTTAETPGSTLVVMSSSATLGHRPVSIATTPAHTAGYSLKSITCQNVKEVSDTGAICLQLNESSTCEHFLEMKGLSLWSAICNKSSHHCQIKLAKSEVEHDCMLLILVGERDPATDVLPESQWKQFGIKSLKRGNVRNHQDFSQKTLIALVTSGLMLAFLGLAGYYLMKRRSWSPAGERLAEDPYYTENGSQGNTMLMMPPQEQAELQEKPNLNGGTQENGTGQVSSKNGHSARQHSPADTEM